MRWTGSQIWKQLPEINVLCTTVGTGGEFPEIDTKGNLLVETYY